MAITAITAVVLEPASRAFVEATSTPPSHDFMMLNPLSATHATRAAVAQATSILRDALWSA